MRKRTGLLFFLREPYDLDGVLLHFAVSDENRLPSDEIGCGLAMVG